MREERVFWWIFTRAPYFRFPLTINNKNRSGLGKPDKGRTFAGVPFALSHFKIAPGRELLDQTSHLGRRLGSPIDNT